MKPISKFFLAFCISIILSSCVSKKEFEALQVNYDQANVDLGKCGEQLSEYLSKISACEQKLKSAEIESAVREERMQDLKEQIEDLKDQRDKQLEQVGDLTVITKEANENISETLSQLERKDQYIHLLHAAKSKADSINLALAVNLKGVLSEGLTDEDVEVKVDKTVVFVNISDKMLFQSGSSNITSRANEVLGKIAKIIQSRPELEVMVEGYTDNLPINTECMSDNWDLSVKRATSVVRVLQKDFFIDPNRLIAAGRGEYNALASNDTYEGRSANRRTRIIILPKLNQFYDLLDPSKANK